MFFSLGCCTKFLYVDLDPFLLETWNTDEVLYRKKISRIILSLKESRTNCFQMMGRIKTKLNQLDENSITILIKGSKIWRLLFWRENLSCKRYSQITPAQTKIKQVQIWCLEMKMKYSLSSIWFIELKIHLDYTLLWYSRNLPLIPNIYDMNEGNIVVRCPSL